jgi:hypothetical protein
MPQLPPHPNETRPYSPHDTAPTDVLTFVTYTYAGPLFVTVVLDDLAGAAGDRGQRDRPGLCQGVVVDDGVDRHGRG